MAGLVAQALVPKRPLAPFAWGGGHVFHDEEGAGAETWVFSDWSGDN